MRSRTSVLMLLPLLATTFVRAEPKEPAVQQTVIDDRTAHVEELRVRGRLQSVTVDPKGPLPRYEIITGDGSRDLGRDANTSRGATGQRVWNVLKF